MSEESGDRGGGGGGALVLCIAVFVQPSTLASLQFRDGARRDFNDQAHITCTRHEAPGGGRVHVLLALVVCPLTTHLFRDGAYGGWYLQNSVPTAQ